MLSLTGVSLVPEILADNDGANILFFTEYSLAESLIGADRKRFEGLPRRKDANITNHHVYVDIGGPVNGKSRVDGTSAERPLSHKVGDLIRVKLISANSSSQELGLEECK